MFQVLLSPGYYEQNPLKPCTLQNPVHQVSVLLERVVSDYWQPVTASVAGILASAVVTILLWILFFKLQLKNNEDRHRHR